MIQWGGHRHVRAGEYKGLWFNIRTLKNSNRGNLLAEKLIRKHRVRFNVKQENTIIYHMTCILNSIGK